MKEERGARYISPTLSSLMRVKPVSEKEPGLLFLASNIVTVWFSLLGVSLVLYVVPPPRSAGMGCKLSCHVLLGKSSFNLTRKQSGLQSELL